MNLIKNGRKLSKSVENTAGKGEIARYEQFLLFPQCFQKDLYNRHVQPGLVWERVNLYQTITTLAHSHTMTPFDAPGKQAFLKTLWEKEKLLVTSNFSFSHSVFYLIG